MENQYENYGSKYQRNIEASGRYELPYWMKVLEKMTYKNDVKYSYSGDYRYKENNYCKYYTPKK